MSDSLQPRRLYSGEGKGNPLQYSCLEKSHGRRSLVDCSPWGREEWDTTERLHVHFSLACIGEGNGDPLQRSCLENPRNGGAVSGVAQSRTRLKRLSSSSRLYSPGNSPGQNTGVGSLSLLQGNIPTQGSNPVAVTGSFFFFFFFLPAEPQGKPYQSMMRITTKQGRNAESF